MHNNFLMGMKLETSWGVDPKIFKNTLVKRVFEKMVSNLSILEGCIECWAIPAIDLLPRWSWMKKWKKVKWKKWRVFWSLIFFNFRYVMGGVKGNNNIGIKVQKKFLMGFKFWTSWGVGPTIFKITVLRWLFSKMVSNLWFFEKLQ